MTAFTARSAVPANSLSGLFVNSGTGPSEPVVSLAGFDVVAQFSRRILQAQVNRSLSQRSVSDSVHFCPGARSRFRRHWWP